MFFNVATLLFQCVKFVQVRFRTTKKKGTTYKTNTKLLYQNTERIRVEENFDLSQFVPRTG